MPDTGKYKPLYEEYTTVEGLTHTCTEIKSKLKCLKKSYIRHTLLLTHIFRLLI